MTEPAHPVHLIDYTVPADERGWHKTYCGVSCLGLEVTDSFFKTTCDECGNRMTEKHAPVHIERKDVPDGELVYVLKLGDKIEVNGHHFVLTEVHAELNKPARLVTKQPIELVDNLDRRVR